MTKNYKKWNMIAGTSIGAILLVSVLALGVLTPQADAGVFQNGNGFPGLGLCGIEGLTVQHWDKIIFSSKKDILNSDGVVIFDKKEIFDIKEIDDPTKIERPLLKAAEKFNSVGWTTEKGELFTPKDLKLIDIEYAIVCGFFDGFPNGNR